MKLFVANLLFCVFGVSQVLASAPGVPDGYEAWDVDKIWGYIVLSSIALNFFIVGKVFKAIDTLSSTKDTSQELCARMNVRPCLKKKEE